MKSNPDHNLFRELSKDYSLVRLHGKDPSTAEGRGWEKWCRKKRDYDRIGFKPDENAGIACGPASGVLTTDVDNPDLFESFCRRHGWHVPVTRTHSSGRVGGGFHLLYGYPDDGQKYGCKSRKTLGIDIKGDGGQVVAPGSIHPDTGTVYAVVNDGPIVEAPEWLTKTLYEDHPEWSHRDVDKLSLPETIKQYVHEEFAVGERSEPLWAILTELCKRGFSDDQIFCAFYSYPCGGKFRTIRTNRDGWLKKQIDKARSTRFSEFSASAESTDDEEDFYLDIKEWPTLPTAALQGIAGAFVELATRSSEADPAAVLASFLCRAGVEFGSVPHLMVGDTPHCARLNAVIVGNSSKARKGTSAKPVLRLFDLNPDNRLTEDPLRYVPARETPGPLSSGEGLVYAVRDEIRKWKAGGKDAEGEWIVVDPGVADKRLFVLDEELAGALKATQREGNTLSVIVRSAFDHGNIKPLTKTNPTRATGAHIGIVSHITMAELHRLLDDTEALNGFANRFLWICSRRKKLVPLPEPMPEDELNRIRRELLGIIDASKRVSMVGLSPEARECWVDGYAELSRDCPGLTGCVTNRGEALVLRLSLVYCLLDRKSSIQVGHLQAASAMWAYAKASAEYIFNGREANPIAQKIIEAVENGPLSMTDIHRSLSNHATKGQIQIAIQELVSSGKVEVVEEKTEGRPKKLIRLAKKAKEAKKGPSAHTDTNERPGEKSERSEKRSGKKNNGCVTCGECSHFDGRWCSRREGSWNGKRGQDAEGVHECMGFHGGSSCQN